MWNTTASINYKTGAAWDEFQSRRALNLLSQTNNIFFYYEESFSDWIHIEKVVTACATFVLCRNKNKKMSDICVPYLLAILATHLSLTHAVMTIFCISDLITFDLVLYVNSAHRSEHPDSKIISSRWVYWKAICLAWICKCLFSILIQSGSLIEPENSLTGDTWEQKRNTRIKSAHKTTQ